MQVLIHSFSLHVGEQQETLGMIQPQCVFYNQTVASLRPGSLMTQDCQLCVAKLIETVINVSSKALNC